MDLKSYSRWDDYSRARDAMFAATSHPAAPWYALRSDDKKRARLNGIKHILSMIPYKRIKRESSLADAVRQAPVQRQAGPQK